MLGSLAPLTGWDSSNYYNMLWRPIVDEALLLKNLRGETIKEKIKGAINRAT